ncbi:hypothetical protein F5882DRAFT_495285 [Hyaloscypha sp. PMI_1271]|nr:hypothetical protein F5882DRAFT_495285 [Hyaloscypha sp. PMI_1271]
MFSPFIGKANDLKASMNAVEAAKLTTAWLSECVSAHEGCGGDESSVLPKRVIHVGSEDVNPRLIETIDGQRGRYVTLSYCWGRSISFITTTANNDHCQFHHPLDGIFNFGASEDDRRRDDLDDWREESSKMASIYQNSTLTLSATCAESVEKGCFSDEGRWFQRIVLQGQAGVFQLVVRMARIICHRCLFGDLASELRNSGREEDLAQRYPVLTRGWIFQERLLSRRTVHCARGDLFWECLVAKKCECTGDFFDPNERGDQLPRGVAVIGPKKKDHTSSSGLLFRVLMLGKALRDAKQLESSFTVTARPVQYRDHNGTVFEALLHFPLGEYYAGLWRAYLCLHLCWGRSPRLMPAVAMRTGEPSWSWSSIAEPCSYIIYLPTIFSERNLDEMEIFRVLEVETTPVGDNFGAISCGKIVGIGPVVDAKIEFRHENDTNALAVGVRVEGSNQVFNVACDICQWKEESDEWAEMQSSDRLVEKETVICVGMLATVHSILSIIHQSTWLVCRKVDGNLKRIGIMTFGTFVPTLNNCFGHELAKYARDETCTLV